MNGANQKAESIDEKNKCARKNFVLYAILGLISGIVTYIPLIRLAMPICVEASYASGATNINTDGYLMFIPCAIPLCLLNLVFGIIGGTIGKISGEGIGGMIGGKVGKIVGAITGGLVSSLLVVFLISLIIFLKWIE